MTREQHQRQPERTRLIAAAEAQVTAHQQQRAGEHAGAAVNSTSAAIRTPRGRACCTSVVRLHGSKIWKNTGFPAAPAASMWMARS